LRSLARRGLRGTKLVISDAYEDFTAIITSRFLSFKMSSNGRLRITNSKMLNIDNLI
jgi:hypothetical protein